MHDSKSGVHARLGLDVVGMCAMVLVQLGEQSLIGSLRKSRFLVDERKNVQRLLGKHVERVLIVLECDLGPIDGLLVVLLLLQLEDVAHEELLKVLVGEVDAELLETAWVLMR